MRNIFLVTLLYAQPECRVLECEITIDNLTLVYFSQKRKRKEKRKAELFVCSPQLFPSTLITFLSLFIIIVRFPSLELFVPKSIGIGLE